MQNNNTDIDRIIAELIEKGEIKRAGNIIYFGSYPQTVKANDVDVSERSDEDGFFTDKDGNKYVKIKAKPFKASLADKIQFANGETIENKKEYYFKVEPIRWRILEENDGRVLLLCDGIIANLRFGENNNYADSEIRSWLNNSFFTDAFNALQKELIQTTRIKNGARSAGYNSSLCACKNTDDKVFLLSYKEVTDAKYKFGDAENYRDSARRMKPSDYAIATGVWLDLDKGDGFGNGWWWLRSACDDDAFFVRSVTEKGSVNYSSNVDEINNGVVPAIILSGVAV